MYSIIITIVKILQLLLHGEPGVIGRNNIPDRPVIFAATHRSWIDPVYLITSLSSRKISFMAKDSLFKIPIIKNLLSLVLAFPVNRENPTTRTIRQATKVITEHGHDLGIFPTGSRYSTTIKSGTAFIQKLSKADIVPIAIQPPKNLWEVLTHQAGWIAFGEPIAYNPSLKYDKHDLQQIDQQLEEVFTELDQLINPNYVYEIPEHKRRD